MILCNTACSASSVLAGKAEVEAVDLDATQTPLVQ